VTKTILFITNLFIFINLGKRENEKQLAAAAGGK
jgi:hypothetical protein